MRTENDRQGGDNIRSDLFLEKKITHFKFIPPIKMKSVFFA